MTELEKRSCRKISGEVSKYAARESKVDQVDDLIQEINRVLHG